LKNGMFSRLKERCSSNVGNLADKELPDEKLINGLHRFIEKMKVEADRSWLVRMVFGGLVETVSPMLAAYFAAKEKHSKESLTKTTEIRPLSKG